MHIYYINGNWVSSDNASVSFNDMGFLYGDGLFETMRFDNKKVFAYNKHLDRILRGLDIINLKIDKTKKELFDLIILTINKNQIESGIIRLMITRGKIEENIPAIYISIKPFYSIPSSPVRVIYLNESKFPIIRFTPAIKSMNYLGNMLAKKETKKLNAFEPVFYNNDNIITECAIRNIFYVKDNIIFTPSLDLGILSGVMRETVIEIAKTLNIEVQEIHINLSDINLMDEAFITSTGIGLLECFWDGWESSFSITKKIKKELFNRIKRT